MGTFKKFNFHGVDIPVEVPENVIAEAVQKYLEEHPVEGVTEERVFEIVNTGMGGISEIKLNAPYDYIEDRQDWGTHGQVLCAFGDGDTYWYTLSEIPTDYHINSLIDAKLTPLEALADSILGVI